jgi:hypothetical protein
MSFDKQYPNRKDKREQYHRSGKTDKTCRPGGSCPYCQRNRAHSTEVRKLKTEEEKEE